MSTSRKTTSCFPSVIHDPKYSNSAAQERLDTAHFEMFTKEGEEAVRKELKNLIHELEYTKQRITPDFIEKRVQRVMDNVGTKHIEVTDTEPAYHIRWHVAKCLDDNFYDYQSFNLVGKL